MEQTILVLEMKVLKRVDGGNDRDLGYTLLNAGGGTGYARTNISTCTKLPCNGDKWNNTNPNIEVCLIKWFP